MVHGMDTAFPGAQKPRGFNNDTKIVDSIKEA